jgi:hypothetical protein
MELDNLQKLSSAISDADLERSFLLNEQSCNVAAAMRERCNAAATLDLTNYNKTGAGSGNFVLFHRISNPRVLSDMGLAIPRPTRLGDPRKTFSYSCILLLFIVSAATATTHLVVASWAITQLLVVLVYPYFGVDRATNSWSGLFLLGYYLVTL